MNLPPRVHVVEVGPRDGFQMETAFLPTELKVELIDLLSRSGLHKIEATSFVHPKVIPQMRDAAEVLARIERRPGVLYTVLVPNLKGLRRAREAGADVARLVVCATDTYNLRNVGLSVDASLEVCREMHAEAGEVAIEAVIGAAFGCPLEGHVPEERVVELAHRFVTLGIRELGIADSSGLAHPRQVACLMGRLKRELPGVELSLHLHDTRGLGLANAPRGARGGHRHLRRLPRWARRLSGGAGGDGAISLPRIWSTSARRWASRPASISGRCARPRAASRSSSAARCRAPSCGRERAASFTNGLRPHEPGAHPGRRPPSTTRSRRSCARRSWPATSRRATCCRPRRSWRRSSASVDSLPARRCSSSSRRA